MTEQTQPTDAEIEAAWTAATGCSILPHPGDMLAFARAVLAKWGTPAGVGEPVARIDARPAPRQKAQKPFCWACWIGEDSDPRRAQFSPVEPLAYSNRKPLYTAQQPTQAQAGAVPLTVVEINGLARKHPAEDLCIWSYGLGVADAEQHHGIKGADHG